MEKNQKLILTKAEENTRVIERGSLEEFKNLISRGFNFDAILSHDHGSLPIHIAAQYGRLDIIEILLANGISVDQTDNDGWTPLYHAVRNKHLAVINRLIVESNLNFVDETGNTILHFACHLGDEAVIGNLLSALEKIPQGDRILSRLNECGYTPLHISCYEGDVEVVSLLLNALERIPISDRNLCIQDIDESTPLHNSCEHGDEASIVLLLNALEKTHETEQNLRTSDEWGNTPLHLACKCDEDEDVDVLAAVDLLLNAVEKIPETERNVNTLNKRGYTPLNYLTNELEKDLEKRCNIIKSLINCGAYFNSKDIVRIADNQFARNILFTDFKLCAQSCLNKLVNETIPSLYDSPLSARLPPRERLMAGLLRTLENCVKIEISNYGYCDFDKLICPLFYLSIKHLSNYYCKDVEFATNCGETEFMRHDVPKSLHLPSSFAKFFNTSETRA